MGKTVSQHGTRNKDMTPVRSTPRVCLIACSLAHRFPDEVPASELVHDLLIDLLAEAAPERSLAKPAETHSDLIPLKRHKERAITKPITHPERSSANPHP